MPIETPPSGTVHSRLGVVWDRLRAELDGESVLRRNEPLARRTTLKVGGPADLYLEPSNEESLALAVRACRDEGVPIFMLGRGSNLLIRDGGIRGAVISLNRPSFCRIEVEGTRLICGAGAKLKEVAVRAKEAGVGGLEFLEGIPGVVGGALRMNAGAMGGWTFGVLKSMRYMRPDGEAVHALAKEVPSEYRRCPLLERHIALSAEFEGWLETKEAIVKRMQESSYKRRSSQPAAFSAGCIFKNPESIPAGRLVEELKMKGARIGGACVSAKHGNFIVNDGAASASEVLALIDQIRQRALEERGIEMETEVQIVGEDPR